MHQYKYHDYNLFLSQVLVGDLCIDDAWMKFDLLRASEFPAVEDALADYIARRNEYSLEDQYGGSWLCSS